MWGAVSRAQDGSRTSNAGKTDGFSQGEILSVGFAAFFAVIGTIVGILQLRYVAREQKARSGDIRRRKRKCGLLRSCFELWFPLKGHPSTVRAWIEEEKAQEAEARVLAEMEVERQQQRWMPASQQSCVT